MRRQQVYHAVDNERMYQDQLWKNDDPTSKQPSAWILWMEHYLSEARRLASTTSETDHVTKMEIMDFIRKVTALGVAAMELHGVNERSNVPIFAFNGHYKHIETGENVAVVKDVFNDRPFEQYIQRQDNAVYYISIDDMTKPLQVMHEADFANEFKHQQIV